jgi:uncharacterized protein DUF5666
MAIQTQMSSRKMRLGACLGFVVVLLTLLASCGADQVAGIEGSGAPVASDVTTTGRINGFGSIFIDGVEYDTATAQITVDDQPATEADLRVGHVVTVAGTLDPDGKKGTAKQVTLTSDVRGDVASVDAVANTFVVLGQTVKVTTDTLFDETTQAQDLAGLKSGAKVRVSGFTSATGEVLASRIDGVTTAALDVQVSGTVKNLDTTAKSFRVNNLTVDYRSATVSGSLSEGSDATVHGTTATDGSLVATQVSVQAKEPVAAGEKGQIEGLITTFSSNSSFVVEGQAVSTNANTKLNLHGLTLATDVFVKVRGTFDGSRVLVADQIEAKPAVASLARGTVDAVSVADGTLRVLGVTAQISASTTFEDKGADKKRQFRLSDVTAGDYVEVRGVAAAGEPLIASAVQRSKAEARSYVQGVAQELASPGFKVLGVSIVTDSNTSFPGLGGGSKGADAFFEQAVNQVVSVRGTMNGNTLVADQVRIVKQ